MVQEARETRKRLRQPLAAGRDRGWTRYGFWWSIPYFVRDSRRLRVFPMLFESTVRVESGT